MEEIANWLNGKRDYERGCLLFHDYGHRVHSQNYYVAVKQSLAAHRSPDKLMKLLVEIYKKLGSKPKQVSDDSSAIMGAVVHAKERGNLGKKEKLLAQLNEQIVQYYQDMGSRWKPKLHEAKTDDERFEIQKVMDRMEDEMRKLLTTIDYVEEHGELPKVERVKKEKSVEANTAKAAMEYMNVQKYLNYYKLKIDNGKKELAAENDNKKREKLEQMLSKWELKLGNYKVRFAELEKLVKG